MNIESSREFLEYKERRFRHPHLEVQEDIDAVYKRGEIVVGDPTGLIQSLIRLPRKNSVAVIGAQLGDEGKGRIVDNNLEYILNKKEIARAFVDRYQGGGNAGHTVENGEIEIALHQVPSGILYERVELLLDSGMVINPENLMHEIVLLEQNKEVGDTIQRIHLSEKATMTTPLEEAEEIYNRRRSADSRGGTGRGISPSAAHRVDRTGLLIRNLIEDDWREELGKRYDMYKRMLAAEGMDLEEVKTPGFLETKRQGSSASRKVGTREEFLDRLENTRDWMVKRGIVKNIASMHQKYIKDRSIGFVFEGAQAIGLHPWLGTFPDVTSTDTSRFGIQTSTGVWRADQVEKAIGVFKATYSSSVGKRRMPTHTNNEWTKLVRNEANEFGTTTGRPRDILYLDLAHMTYNINMGGIDVLAATHLDIAKEGENIMVCTHYTDSNGELLPYQPDLKYLADAIPNYEELPGWDGNKAAEAEVFEDLPLEAQQFLSFIQRRTATPIVAGTTGPKREQYIDF